MIIDQAEFALITNPKIRRRILHLPVKHGKHGERKKCPARPGGVYRLHARPPYELYRARADDLPTRARAVLHLIDLCGRPERTETITVREKPTIATVDGVEVYVVRFVKGDQAANLDRPFYLAKSGSNYTFSASRQSVPGDPEVSMPFAKDLEKARREAGERRITPEQEGVKRLRAASDTLFDQMVSMKRRNRLRLVQKELDKIAAEADAESRQETDQGGTLAESVCAARQASASQSGPRPSGTNSEAPLESAA